MVGVERWAEVRRMKRVEGLSGRDDRSPDGVGAGHGLEAVGGGRATAVFAGPSGVDFGSVQGLDL